MKSIMLTYSPYVRTLFEQDGGDSDAQHKLYRYAYSPIRGLPRECRDGARKKKDPLRACYMSASLIPPHALESDDLLSTFAAVRKDIPEDEHTLFRAEYFSKGQACMRASPLVKTFGWAIHHESAAKIALIDPTSAHFSEISNNLSIKHVTGMRNKRA